jgi:hypothetical protein
MGKSLVFRRALLLSQMPEGNAFLNCVCLPDAEKTTLPNGGASARLCGVDFMSRPVNCNAGCGRMWAWQKAAQTE